jgi:Baseplate J-like protein
MNTQYHCAHERRRDLVKRAVDGTGAAFLNGIDFLEVSATDQRELTIHFLQPLPGQANGVPSTPQLTPDNFAIEGGTRLSNVSVETVDSTTDDRIVLHTNIAGDFSTYTLRLVSSKVISDPPPGFDPALAEVSFSFRINCDTGLDCAIDEVCVEPPLPVPHLSYLAKDYATFRRLVLDRLSATMPDWNERSAADLGIALVEVLAYAGDHLSYFQDSVATEAYLGTARRRTSVRRHARLVDYSMHDGANARVWLTLETTSDRGTALIPALPAGSAVGLAKEVTSSGDPLVFETMHDLGRLTVSRNSIRFHTWGDENCCLPAGATRATLVGSPGLLELSRGDVIVFEEILGPESGLPVDADTRTRHAVRLSSDPIGSTDPLTQLDVTAIQWFDDDALPFPLCLSEFDDGLGGIVQATVARANVVLADHGRTVTSAAPGAHLVPPLAPIEGRYRPFLLPTGLTHAGAYEHDKAKPISARAATDVDVRTTMPVIHLRGDGDSWSPQRTLLGSDRFATDFVVEMEDDGRAHLRFGDGVFARVPPAGTSFAARYRLGSGSGGNVGAEALCRLVLPIDGVTIRNPMPALGGRQPEPIRQVKLDAPQAFRRQERAVVPADYAAVAERHPDVQRAAATRRWTGSWYTMFVTVDRRDGRPVDSDFESELRAFLERFRTAGYDLEVDGPHYVPLEVELTICVDADHDRSEVELALRDALSDRHGTGGPSGFFHPDNFTFGQPVYLSQLLARVADVQGVERIVSVDKFSRYGETAQGEIEQGYIPIHRLEIARLDNDPSNVENGLLTLKVRGGR